MEPSDVEDLEHRVDYLEHRLESSARSSYERRQYVSGLGAGLYFGVVGLLVVAMLWPEQTMRVVERLGRHGTFGLGA